MEVEMAISVLDLSQLREVTSHQDQHYTMDSQTKEVLSKLQYPILGKREEQYATTFSILRILLANRDQSLT